MNITGSFLVELITHRLPNQSHCRNSLTSIGVGLLLKFVREILLESNPLPYHKFVLIAVTDPAEDEPDMLGVSSTMRYLQDLGVNIEHDDITPLILMEALQAPSFGEITKEGFVTGWRNLK